jgi:hypothetical protein
MKECEHSGVALDCGVESTTIDALERYVKRYIRPGHFLMAVLSNDLEGAVMRADDHNYKHLSDVVVWVCNNIPGDAWGNPTKVNAWLMRRE